MGAPLEPLLLSTRLPTAEELEQLLYETARHEAAPPAYVHIVPHMDIEPSGAGGGTPSPHTSPRAASEYLAHGGLLEGTDAKHEDGETEELSPSLRRTASTSAEAGGGDHRCNYRHLSAVTPDELRLHKKKAGRTRA